MRRGVRVTYSPPQRWRSGATGAVDELHARLRSPYLHVKVLMEWLTPAIGK